MKKFDVKNGFKLVKELAINYPVALALVAVFIFFSLFAGMYLKMTQEILLTLSIPPIILTISFAFLVISGEFDLSMAAQYTLAQVIVAKLCLMTDPSIAIPLTLACGVLAGLLNGLIVCKLKINSFICTLGTLWIFYGLFQIISDGKTIAYRAGPSLIGVFSGEIYGIPAEAIWLIAIAVCFFILLEKTKFGNWVKGSGGNVSVAKAMGVRTDRTKLICFMQAGLVSAFAGIMRISQVFAVVPILGMGLTLRYMAGAFIGGVAMRGGTGTIQGAVLGALLLPAIDSGLVCMGMKPFYFNMFLGLVLLLAVLAYGIKERRFGM